MEIKIKKLYNDTKIPEYAHTGDVGMDMFSREETTILYPGERKIFFTGFAMSFPNGYAAIVKDKSSLPAKFGIHTMGGVFDAGYRGEYNAQLINLGNESVTIEKGQKIAQLIIFPVEIPTITEVNELSKSERGHGNFGSTGKF